MKKHIMIIGLMLATLLTACGANTKGGDAVDSEKKIIGYLPSYRMEVANQIDYGKMTQVNLSFATYASGKLSPGFEDADLKNLVDKCHDNDCKAVIAIGGWGGFENDGIFTSPEGREDFNNQVMDLVEEYNLDGVDIDIELEDADIWENFDAVISDLSERLHAQNKTLTMAVSPWFTSLIKDSTYDYFDFIGLMTYDYHMDGTGDVAPMEQITDNVAFYESKGVSKDRMVIGVPFYGYDTAGAKTYGEMVQKDKANADKDFADGVYYNGRETIKKKTQLAKDEYAGIMFWEAGQDSFDEYSLLTVIYDVMNE
ncbi:MAG: hypothetical protein K5773_07075 [Pseudobutyrivibrio sp.]|nr:hypothetical protein [Pseudobutyrivibrio sp.]